MKEATIERELKEEWFKKRWRKFELAMYPICVLIGFLLYHDLHLMHII